MRGRLRISMAGLGFLTEKRGKNTFINDLRLFPIFTNVQVDRWPIKNVCDTRAYFEDWAKN